MKHIIILIVLIILPSSTLSQHTGIPVDKKMKKWSLSFCLAIGVSESSIKDIESQLENSGFGDRSPGSFWGPGSDHPNSSGTRLTWITQVKFKLKYPFAVGAIFNNAHLGRTTGYQSDTYLSITIEHAALCFGPMMYLSSDKGYGIGIGPTLYDLKAWNSDVSHNESQRYSEKKLGFIIAFDIIAPQNSSIYFDILIHYMKAGRATVGPFTDRLGDNQATIPAFNVNYDRFLLGFGVGIRI
jgi:hypothetical protein